MLVKYMNKNIKRILLIVTFLLGMFICTENSVASTTSPSPGGSTPTLEDKLCEIRLVFCNTGAIAIISFAIIFIGFLIFMGKLHWTTVIIFVAGMVVFVQAHNVSKSLSGNPNFQVKAACACQGSPYTGGGNGATATTPGIGSSIQ